MLLGLGWNVSAQRLAARSRLPCLLRIARRRIIVTAIATSACSLLVYGVLAVSRNGLDESTIVLCVVVGASPVGVARLIGLALMIGRGADRKLAKVWLVLPSLHPNIAIALAFGGQRR